MSMLRRTAWIWLIGCIAWSVDGLASLYRHRFPHAAVALVLAALFLLAWSFSRKQTLTCSQGADS